MGAGKIPIFLLQSLQPITDRLSASFSLIEDRRIRLSVIYYIIFFGTDSQ